jgi:hypothetical protein
MTRYRLADAYAVSERDFCENMKRKFNPWELIMITNPFIPSPPQASAWSEGFLKGFSAGGPVEASDSVDADSMDAFNQGVVAGEQAGANGIEPDDACVSASEDHDAVDGPLLGFDAVDIGVGFAKTVAHGMSSLFVALVELAVNLPHRAQDPEQVLPGVGESFSNALSAMGLGSMELFAGAGVDPLASECEIKLTSIFKSQDQARAATIALGRQPWIVARWRTDQSNSFTVVDQS